MVGRRGAGSLLAGFALIAVLAVEPAAAQGFDTVTEQLIRELNQKLLALAIPVTLVVEGILFYTVWRFRKSDEPQPTRENRELEITWTVATAVILLFVGVASYGVLASPFVATGGENLTLQAGGEGAGDLGADGDVAASGASAAAGDAARGDARGDAEPVVVEVTGFQWFWRFTYPGEDVSNVTDEMVVPVNRTIVVRTTSNDVIHAFHVPEMGLKSDAIPGQWNTIRTRAFETGTHTLFCAEFCGVGHAEMLANVSVVEEERYEEWLADRRNASG